MITFLTKKLPRYGSKSGYYSQLVRHAQGSGARLEAIMARPGLTDRIYGKLWSTWLRCPHRNQAGAAAEFRFRCRWEFRRRGIFHVLNLDDHLPLLDSWRKPPRNLVGTLHHPPSHWSPKDLQRLSRLSLAIVLCQRDADFFSAHVSRVHFVRHGVDTDFFTPAVRQTSSPSLLLVGNWMRDFDVAAATINRLRSLHPELTFDFVVERATRHSDALRGLEGLPSVRWHHEVDDATLLKLYQQATLLFLPLLDTSANNAVVEALACGLPIVTNRIGGIADYGGGDLFQLVPEPQAEAFASVIDGYLREPQRRIKVGQRSRAWAEEHLAWSRIWKRHQAAYDLLPKA